jgi:hypothetical protein
LFLAAGKQEIPGEKELTMNRIITLTSGALFATGLAALPISGFAQQTVPGGKTDAQVVSPAMQTGNTPATAQTAVSRDMKTTHAQHDATQVAKKSASKSKDAAPATDQPTGSRPTAQHKTLDPTKS